MQPGADSAPWAPQKESDLTSASEPPSGSVWAVELTQLEKEIRDRFAVEYVKDFDAVAAAMRCGYAHAYAFHMAKQFMSCTYTERRIDEEETRVAAIEDEKFWRTEVIKRLRREGLGRGTDNGRSARVSAMKEIKALHGLDAPVKSEVTHNGNVFMIPDNGRDKPELPNAPVELLHKEPEDSTQLILGLDDK